MDIKLNGHYGYRRLIRTAIPSALMMLITESYSIIDAIFVSRFAGSTAFAAINLAWPILMVVAALGIMIGTGGSALVSKFLGQKNESKASATFGMMIRFTFIAGLVFSLVCLLCMDSITKGMGADGLLAKECLTYSRIAFLAMPFFCIQVAFQSFYMTAEKPQMGTIMSIVCGVANILLDALFIIVFHWGVAGAAAATGISQLIGGIFPLYFFRSRYNRTKLRIYWKPMDWKSIGKACSNGMSEYIGNISFNVMNICYNIQLMRYIGEAGITSYGVLLYIAFAFAAILIGFNISTLPVIGYNYGAENKAELKSLLRKSMTILFVIGCILTALSEIFSNTLAGLFIGYDSDLTAMTAHAIRIYMISFMLCGPNLFVSVWFTGLNNGLISAFSALTRNIGFELGCVFLLPLWFGLDGIWMAVDIADGLAILLNGYLIIKYRKHYGY